MDYERIRRPIPTQGAGLSPGKLRSMLLGAEKRSKEDDELERVISSTDDAVEAGISYPEDFKDVLECSSFINSQMRKEHKTREIIVGNSMPRYEDDLLTVSCDQDYESVSSSHFEFQKADRIAHRAPLTPFSKPAPSKWDDAQKWIASPTSNRLKSGQSQLQPISSARKGFLGYATRQISLKNVVEASEQKFEDAETKRIDLNQTKKEVKEQNVVSYALDHYPVADSYAVASSTVSLSQYGSSISSHGATTFIPPPSTVRSVSMRDMGTEMTPVPSQEPSRTGTPVKPATPQRSPNSSEPTTPERGTMASLLMDNQVNLNKKELSNDELQLRTRREIMALGKQLGKVNIATWASKADKNGEASNSQNLSNTDIVPAKSEVETHAFIWEEAEKAKYFARYKREEMKIQAWENDQKAKAEAEMRKMEIEIERMSAKAQEKLMNKLTGMRFKAEEKRAAAEVIRNNESSKTEEQAEGIRKTRKIPTWSCCACCL